MTGKTSDQSIEALQEKIVELSLKLKNKSRELDIVKSSSDNLYNKLIHNLKNPIGVTFSFSDIILENLANDSPDKLEKHIGVIRNSAEFGIELLNSFSRYIRSKPSEKGYSKENVDYIALIKKRCTHFTPKAINNNVEITTKYSVDELFLDLHEDDISFVIDALLSNALRFSNPNTTIRIEVTDKQSFVETVISDEGIGISEKDLPFILNEFYVVNTYSEDRKKCIGLGLATVNNLVLKHQGTLSVTSSSGKGSQFKITLPKN